MNRHLKYVHCAVLTVVILLFSVGCSTEKNTLINRTYHSVTAKYNGYFNAKELIRIGLKDYRQNYREDFTQILPIEVLPNDEDVMDFYPVVDTAIKKCETVISKHSMPTASKPSKKKTEYANWVDMNWVLIGKAQFIRRDYQDALDNFEYVRKFYMDRSSTYIAQLWEAKCQIEMGLYPDAQRTLQKLENRRQIFLNEAQGQNIFLYKRRIRKMRRKKKKVDIPPAFPKSLYLEVAKTKANLAFKRKEYNEAVSHLQEALTHARKKEDKARLNFIIGQVLQKQEDEQARHYYSETLKKSPTFEMGFQARIKRAVSGGEHPDNIQKELGKMLDEPKYMEYKDQVYYAMAKVELDRPDVPEAKYFLSKSVFYSLNNDRQKGISYEKLGDLTFKERNYVIAQKYYDSSARVIPEDYFNAENIKIKAEKLQVLVDAVNIVEFEDSVQMIAAMSEEERNTFLEGVVEQLKEEERIRKEREAEKAAKLREMQMKQAEQSGLGGNRFYFQNMKAMNEGFEDFRSQWGQRENEDHWRRSNKQMDLSFKEMESDTLDTIADQDLSREDVAVEELTPEMLLNDIPLTDSALQLSHENLIEALYVAGMVYKEQLDELEQGANQFQRIVDHGIENKHNPMAAFQLYEIEKERNPSRAGKHKDYILNNYPDSDYANYLKDPDYFVKKKEMDALAQKEYLKSVERYERGLYFPVIRKAESVIESEPDNKYRPQYFILKAMAMGRINNDKSSLIPVLTQAIEEYPETPTAERAQELLDLINSGVPAFEPVDFTAGQGIYEYTSKAKMHVLIYLSEGDDIRESQRNISDFNREFFSRDRLKTSSQLVTGNITMIKVSEFKDEYHASDYLRDFKKTKKYLRDLRNNKIIFISSENFKALLKERKLEDYETFFKNTY